MIWLMRFRKFGCVAFAKWFLGVTLHTLFVWTSEFQFFMVPEGKELGNGAQYHTYEGIWMPIPIFLGSERLGR